MKNLTSYWQRLNPLTKKLLIFAYVNTVVINFFIIVFFSSSWSWNGTVLYHVAERFLLARQGLDSWNKMFTAFDQTQAGSQKPLYSEILFERKIRFQYPPTSLLFLYPLKSLCHSLELLQCEAIRHALNYISWISVPILIIFVVRIFRISLENNLPLREEPLSRTDFTLLTVLSMGLALTYFPMIRAYTVGQIQAWINLLFAVMFWCWMMGKKGMAGVMVALICMIKPQYFLIVFWGVLRKQWKFVMTFGLMILTGLSISIGLFGLLDHTNYFSALSFLAQRGEVYYPNQSMNGLLNRLLFNGDILKWHTYVFPDFNVWVYLGTTITSLVLILPALFWPVKQQQSGGITDLSIIAVTCTVASPIAWEYHYGILLPIYAYALACLWKRKIFGRMTLPYLGISYILTSNNYFDFTKRFAYAPFGLNIVLSYLFAGALMLLVSLYLLRSFAQEKEGNEMSYERTTA